MRLLILGGTVEGRRMAEDLHAHRGRHADDCTEQSITVIYSVAGLVRVPQLPCKVVSGGFTRFGGLPQYIRDNGIDALLDMTHPYAQLISQKASDAAVARGIPCWRFHRPAWVPQAQDDWVDCRDWPDVLRRVEDKASILFTAGQMDAKVLGLLESLYGKSSKSYVLRTAVPPESSLPPGMHWIEAIGPFSLEGESSLMQEFAIDALVSKNSGGDSTSAKLTAARNRGIPVYMLSRPQTVPTDGVFEDYDQCLSSVLDYSDHLAAGRTGALG